MTDRYEGCGADGCDHHSTGKRAWCMSCSEWCYPDPEMRCVRGELERTKARIDAAAKPHLCAATEYNYPPGRCTTCGVPWPCETARVLLGGPLTGEAS